VGVVGSDDLDRWSTDLQGGFDADLQVILAWARFMLSSRSKEVAVMIRGASHPLGMMLPGAQLTGATGFALLRFGVERSVVLSSRSTAGKRSR
jgi:hypothetical protein